MSARRPRPEICACSFFKNAVDFKRGNWDEALARALITGDFKGVVDMKDSSFAMGTVFDSIIE